MQVEFMLGMMERSRIPFYIRTFPGNTSDEGMFSKSLPEMMSLLDYGDMHSHDDVKDRLLEDMERRRDEGRQGRKGRGRPKEGDGSPSFDQPTGPGSLLFILRALGNASWVVMDNGGASQYNTKAIMGMGHEYLTRKTMGAKDVAFFENGEAVAVEPGLTCVSHTFESSGRTKYVFSRRTCTG